MPHFQSIGRISATGADVRQAAGPHGIQLQKASGCGGLIVVGVGGGGAWRGVCEGFCRGMPDAMPSGAVSPVGLVGSINVAHVLEA